MFIKNILEEIQIKIESPANRFLFLSLGIVTGALILLATGVLESLMIAILMSISLGIGGWMVGNNVNPPLITSALPLMARRRK